jgi:hypothetical protein
LKASKSVFHIYLAQLFQNTIRNSKKNSVNKI